MPARRYGREAIERRIDRVESGLSESQRRAIGTLEPLGRCRWIPLFSIHGQGFGCYSTEQGIIKTAIDSQAAPH